MSSIVHHNYNNAQVDQRESDEYVNLTQLCQSEGKLVADYLRLENTKAFIEALASDMGIPISQIIQTKKGGTSSEQGTWAHPEIAMDCAQWVSIPCRIWANRNLVRIVREQQTQQARDRLEAQHKRPTPRQQASNCIKGGLQRRHSRRVAVNGDR